MNSEDEKDNKSNPYIIKVIVETPQGSRNKYAWNEKLKLIELKDNLPVGTHFPYDFGFIPDTLAPDGDPVDIVILTDMPAFPGCVVPCKVIGIIRAEQKELDGKIVENDRVIAVSIQCASLRHHRSIKDIDRKLVDQLIQFFIDYEKELGKKFMPKRIGGPTRAMKVINSYIEDKKIDAIADTPFQLKAKG